MKMNDLDKLEKVLLSGDNEITIDEDVRIKAEVSISPDIKITGDA